MYKLLYEFMTEPLDLPINVFYEYVIIHPHKFRRSMATRAIDKGMPIEQVQRLLGHSQIDTTMRYAMVNQNNVKVSHGRYIA